MIPDTPCKLWHLSLNKKGYGIKRYQGSMQLAHRVIYITAHGDLPEGYDVHHKCETRNCVELQHLEAIPHKDNVRYSKGWTKTETGEWLCKVGHLMTGFNVRSKGKTIDCRTCHYERRKYRC